VLGGLAASFADVPAVVSRRVDNAEMQLVAALRYRPFRRIIAISETIAAVLCNNGIDGDRITVIKSAVDADAFAGPFDRDAFRAEFGFPAGALIIGAAGQLIERKGYRYLLDAVARLAAAHPSLCVAVFGEGPLEERLREQAARLGIDGIVRFLGFRADLDRYFGCFDIFAHPALSEGLGVATLKAQAAGVPVVGFAAGGLVEAVEHETTGLLVAPEDTDALARALASLVVNADLRERMGAAGRQRARRDFSVDVMADAHVALYQEITGDDE
jgi:glycosyltransferase involved in cell wall biosynthesis